MGKVGMLEAKLGMSQIRPFLGVKGPAVNAACRTRYAQAARQPRPTTPQRSRGSDVADRLALV